MIHPALVRKGGVMKWLGTHTQAERGGGIGFGLFNEEGKKARTGFS
jgi:hypothetical protein